MWRVQEVVSPNAEDLHAASDRVPGKCATKHAISASHEGGPLQREIYAVLAIGPEVTGSRAFSDEL